MTHPSKGAAAALASGAEPSAARHPARSIVFIPMPDLDEPAGRTLRRAALPTRDGVRVLVALDRSRPPAPGRGRLVLDRGA